MKIKNILIGASLVAAANAITIIEFNPEVLTIDSTTTNYTTSTSSRLSSDSTISFSGGNYFFANDLSAGSTTGLSSFLGSERVYRITTLNSNNLQFAFQINGLAEGQSMLLDSFSLDYGTSSNANSRGWGVSTTISLDDSSSYFTQTTTGAGSTYWGNLVTLDTGLDTAFTEAQRTLSNGAVVTINMEFTDDSALTSEWHYLSNMIVEGTVIGTAVPEPTSLALLGLGGLALVVRRKR